MIEPDYSYDIEDRVDYVTKDGKIVQTHIGGVVEKIGSNYTAVRWENCHLGNYPNIHIRKSNV